MLRVPEPDGGLATTGSPAEWTNSRASSSVPTRRYWAQGKPCADITLFIRSLSRKFRVVSTLIPGIPSSARTLSHRNLQLLEGS